MITPILISCLFLLAASSAIAGSHGPDEGGGDRCDWREKTDRGRSALFHAANVALKTLTAKRDFPHSNERSRSLFVAGIP